MSEVWIPSDEEHNEMCRRCENSSSNALKLLKTWIDDTRRSRPVCKETFSPNGAKESRQAPLVLAANFHNAHIVRYLLTKYSSVIDVDCRGDLGNHVVGIYRSVAVTHKLHIDFGGVTALWVACKRGNRVVAQLLLRAGADVNAATTNSNSTPMEIAAFNGHSELMELLYSYGADVNMRDGQECSPLMAATIANHSNALIFLLEHGADVSQKNTKGYTVFHVAAANGNLNAIHVLLSKGFLPSFELPQLDTVPCPYFIAVNLGYYEIAENLKQTHIHTKEYESETLLLLGARRDHEITKVRLLSPLQSVLEHWREAIRLRNACEYMPEFFPPSDVYTGLSEVVTERDLFHPPKHGELDMEAWIRYQSLLIKQRIVGPPFMLEVLLDCGVMMCEKKLFRHAELLWLQFIEYYSEHSANIFISSEVPHYKTCIRVFASGISKMVKKQYWPNFSKFVRFCFKLLTEIRYTDTDISESILRMFASWIRSERNIREGDYYSDECEELGRELVSQQFHMNDNTTLLQLLVSNFNKNVHTLFGAEYEHLVYALLRWGCERELYYVRGCTHPIHEAVRVGNEYHVDIVTPLLRYGCSPLFVDSKGRTALQLATSDVIKHKLRAYSLSLFSMCCVAIVQYGFPYESLELPSAIKSNIRLFDKKSRCVN